MRQSFSQLVLAVSSPFPVEVTRSLDLDVIYSAVLIAREMPVLERYAVAFQKSGHKMLAAASPVCQSFVGSSRAWPWLNTFGGEQADEAPALGPRSGSHGSRRTRWLRLHVQCVDGMAPPGYIISVHTARGGSAPSVLTKARSASVVRPGSRAEEAEHRGDSERG